MGFQLASCQEKPIGKETYSCRDTHSVYISKIPSSISSLVWCFISTRKKKCMISTNLQCNANGIISIFNWHSMLYFYDYCCELCTWITSFGCTSNAIHFEILSFECEWNLKLLMPRVGMNERSVGGIPLERCLTSTRGVNMFSNRDESSRWTGAFALGASHRVHSVWLFLTVNIA